MRTSAGKYVHTGDLFVHTNTSAEVQCGTKSQDALCVAVRFRWPVVRRVRGTSAEPVQGQGGARLDQAGALLGNRADGAEAWFQTGASNSTLRPVREKMVPP